MCLETRSDDGSVIFRVFFSVLALLRVSLVCHGLRSTVATLEVECEGADQAESLD